MTARKMRGRPVDQEWYTPPVIIEAARESMGSIDLDVASSSVANRTVGACRFFTRQDDGLSQEWAGNVWCNPPYNARQIRLWYTRVVEHDAPACILMPNSSGAAHVVHALRTADSIVWVDSRIVRGWHGPASVGQDARGPYRFMWLMVALFRCGPSPLWDAVGPVR